MTSSDDKRNNISKEKLSSAPVVTSVKFSPRMTTSARNVERRENGEIRTYKRLTPCPACDSLGLIDDGDYLCSICREAI